MINILSYILFALAVTTLCLGINVHFKEDSRDISNRLFLIFCLSSTGWSFCWSMLLGQVEAFPAYIWRSIGMISVFAYLITATLLLAHYSGIQGFLRKYIILFSFLGIIIYPSNIRRSATHFEMAWFGMAYKFNPDFWTNTYTIYSVIIALNIAIMLIYMVKNAKRQYQKALARKLIYCEIGLVAGMMLDTVLPLFGLGAFPGSTLGQAVSVLLMYPAVIFSNNSRITFSNFSEYICYSTELPILITDETGRLQFSNDSALQFFHLANDQLTTMHINQLYDIKPLPVPNQPKIMKLELPCKLNHSYCSLHFSKIDDAYDDLIGFIVIVTDLTDKQAMIRELAEERDRANRANEAKSTFLAKMSHEIRTPINAILGMDELLLREAQSGSLKNYALDIKSAGRSLLSIINDILDFSKIESGKMELVEDTYKIGRLIHDIKNVLSVKAEDKGLNFQINLAEDIPSALCGDEVRIRQIITNLLNNAIKYTEKGCVTLDVSWMAVPTVSSEASADDSTRDPGIFPGGTCAKLIFKVTDTGIGIRKEDLSVLFNAFQRLDSHKTHSIEGTGLGLSIVKRLVELMNGTIEVDSIYGEGSTFTFTLFQKIIDFAPTGSLASYESASDTASDTHIQLTAPKARVLIVDDNRVNLAVLKGLLKRTMVQVDTVLSGAQCLEKIQDNQYDIIYLDHMMPEMDGIETLEQMKKMEHNKSKNAFVIALTANAILGAEEMYLSHGFDAYLSKPVEGAKLERMLFENIPQKFIVEQNI